MGGCSSEREISLKSGHGVFEALKSAGCDCVALDIVQDEKEKIKREIERAQIDVAFIALHGRGGEDGTIQSLLDELQIPYTGSNRQASERAFNKLTTQTILKEHPISVPPFQTLNRSQKEKIDAILKQWSASLVVKPLTEGSSLGVSIVKEKGLFIPALEKAWGYGDTALIEKYIQGKELTVGIFDGGPLPVIEIVPHVSRGETQGEKQNSFFDFQAKYQAGMSEYKIPARIPDGVSQKIQDAAWSVHQMLGCADFSRVNVMLDENNQYYILEINTIPGFTATSLLPKAAKYAGISFERMCLRLLQLAYDKKKEIDKSPVHF